jgi:threonine dehydrogenase-like Zn-dependent dehydrogenase
VPEQATVMVLERFGAPLRPQAVPLPSAPREGVLVKIAAAGVCGSDLDIVEGRDPRIHLPLVPGHEGVGWVVEAGDEACDLFGHPLEPGDLIVWNRGLSCGRCYYCAVQRRPARCPHRRVYGITFPADEPPGLNGCYATHLYLRPGTHVLKLPAHVDPASVVAATCSGATAAHAIEQADVQVGEAVVVIGPGPLGLFAAALAWQRGAREVMVVGTARGAARLALAARFGCRILNVAETTPAQRRQVVEELTFGAGADVVIDAAGTANSVTEALALVGRGGRVVLPGIATPLGEVPLALYEQVVSKNVRLQGTWVSDTAHLWQALVTVLSGRFPLAEMVTHRFPIEQANEALAALRRREAIKAVLVAEKSTAP